MALGIALPAEIFRTGDRDAITIPLGLELPGEQVTVRQDGARLVIERAGPAPRAAHPANQALVDLVWTLEPIDEEFGPIDDPPPESVEL